MATLTKGNVIVENIKVGDIHYEYEYGIGLKVKVITTPTRDADGQWTWKAESSRTGRIITYMVNEKYPHYAPNLYDYEAYQVKNML